MARRGTQHRGGLGIEIREIIGGLTKREARGVEQVLIDSRGLKKNGGDLVNQINGISRRRKQDYEELTAIGRKLLESIGYQFTKK